MATYTIQHLDSAATFTRPAIHPNPFHRTSGEPAWTKAATSEESDPTAIESFHRSLPDHAETPLHALPSLASELGVSGLFVKDESTRLGLPAFKILGASWAMHRVACERLGLPVASTLGEVRAAIEGRRGKEDLRIVTSTEGNWGRACARMGRYLGVPVRIYVPGFMGEYTRGLIRGEGAEVRVLEGGSYDDTIEACRGDVEGGWVMVMDVSWEGYEVIPQWVTDGYGTMLFETDRQVRALAGGRRANTFFVAVGVGSWAHAVISHYKAIDPESRIVTVEPTTASSLKESLHCDRLTPIKTGETIMAGMNCGTVSKIAWPIMREGVHTAMMVEDRESHESVLYLQAQGVNAGPCGAATLAALRKSLKDVDAETRRQMVVVLFSTEGWREYEVPQ